jgi:hypothetical protein
MTETLTVPSQSHLVILSATWWTPATPAGGTIGAVLIHDTITGTLRAYIGNGDGFDEEADTITIAQWGAELIPAVGRAVFPAWASGWHWKDD